MTLNVNSLLCRQSYACLTTRLRLESQGFRYKVALYVRYLHIKFDDKVKGNPFEFQAYFQIRLRPKFGFTCSKISQLLRLTTQIYSSERSCDK